MARVRSAHPGAAKDEDVASMSITARLVWAFLPCHADREGRLLDKPFSLRLEIMPTDAVDMNAILDEIASRNHILRYVGADGRRYIQIRSFARWQKPHNNEAASIIPPPPGILAHTAAQVSAIGGSPPTNGESEPTNGGRTRPFPDPSPDPVPSPEADPDEDSPEPPRAASAPPSPLVLISEQSDPPVLEFPTVGRGGASWPLSRAKATEWAGAYPGVDVIAESRKALQWLRDNPTRRKTAQGMPAFLGRWLGRAQNAAPAMQRSGGGMAAGPPQPPRARKGEALPL